MELVRREYDAPKRCNKIKIKLKLLNAIGNPFYCKIILNIQFIEGINSRAEHFHGFIFKSHNTMNEIDFLAFKWP